MKQGEFKIVAQVWAALDRGEEVFWQNNLYHITVEDWHPRNSDYTKRKGKCLRVTCKSNYFGSLLYPEEIKNLFTESERK